METKRKRRRKQTNTVLWKCVGAPNVYPSINKPTKNRPLIEPCISFTSLWLHFPSLSFSVSLFLCLGFSLHLCELENKILCSCVRISLSHCARLYLCFPFLRMSQSRCVSAYLSFVRYQFLSWLLLFSFVFCHSGARCACIGSKNFHFSLRLEFSFAYNN